MPLPARATVCIVGPLLGGNTGWVVSQGEILADLLKDEGYEILTTSHLPRRLPRLVDTVRSLFSWRSKIDVAIVTVFSGPAFRMAQISTRILAFFKVPMILCLRGGDLPAYTARYGRRVKRVLERGRYIVSPSPYLVREVDALGLEGRIVPNIVKLTFPQVAREGLRPRLLWMRTFHELYNPQMAVHVLARLRQRGVDATMTMAGQEKGELAAVKELAVELGVDEFVDFPGFLDDQGKLARFAEHDVFLHTNRVDNMPVSVLEAAAAGLALVVTDVGGMPDLLEHERSALFVPSEDADAMVEAIERLLASPQLAAEIIDGARQIARAATWDSVRTAWFEMIDEAGGRIGEFAA